MWKQLVQDQYKGYLFVMTLQTLLKPFWMYGRGNSGGRRAQYKTSWVIQGNGTGLSGTINAYVGMGALCYLSGAKLTVPVLIIQTAALTCRFKKADNRIQCVQNNLMRGIYLTC